MREDSMPAAVSARALMAVQRLPAPDRWRDASRANSQHARSVRVSRYRVHVPYGAGGVGE